MIDTTSSLRWHLIPHLSVAEPILCRAYLITIVFRFSELTTTQYHYQRASHVQSPTAGNININCTWRYIDPCERLSKGCIYAYVRFAAVNDHEPHKQSFSKAALTRQPSYFWYFQARDARYPCSYFRVQRMGSRSSSHGPVCFHISNCAAAASHLLYLILWKSVALWTLVMAFITLAMGLVDVSCCGCDEMSKRWIRWRWAFFANDSIDWLTCCILYSSTKRAQSPSCLGYSIKRAWAWIWQ